MVDEPIGWLLRADPAVAALAARDLLGRTLPRGTTTSSPLLSGLLDGLDARPTAPPGPYRKWTGAHWRLISLAELGLEPGHPAGTAACTAILDFLNRPAHVAGVQVIDGRARRCGSQEGNAIAVACRLGLAGDPRTRALAERLVQWQWPDGGWNCDLRPEARHSSFHETVGPLWGLAEYADATGDRSARDAADRAADLLLRHEVVFAGTGALIHPDFGVPHYPPYWHYDVLQGLLILGRAGHGDDPRTGRARQLLTERRRPDGRWTAARRWWRPPGSAGGNVETVDWGEAARQMVTLNALRVGAGGAASPGPAGVTPGR